MTIRITTTVGSVLTVASVTVEPLSLLRSERLEQSQRPSATSVDVLVQTGGGPDIHLHAHHVAGDDMVDITSIRSGGGHWERIDRYLRRNCGRIVAPPESDARILMCAVLAATRDLGIARFGDTDAARRIIAADMAASTLLGPESVAEYECNVMGWDLFDSPAPLSRACCHADDVLVRISSIAPMSRIGARMDILAHSAGGEIHAIRLTRGLSRWSAAPSPAGDHVVNRLHLLDGTVMVMNDD